MSKQEELNQATGASQSRSNNLLCPECGDKMEFYDAPEIRLELKVPFTNYSIQLFDWGHQELCCMRCMNDAAEEPLRAIYNQGCEDGYAEGYRNAERV